MISKKKRLTTQCTSKDDCGANCRSITLIWDSGHVGDVGELLQWFDAGFFLNWDVVTWLVEYRLGERQELVHFGLGTSKGGRQELVHSGKIIYHRDRDEDGRLVSWDVRGWWVARGIFWENYQDSHLIGRSSVMRFYSHV